MEPDEARRLRRLLTYDENTAGGLMTTEPVILGPDATVAEALALVRRHELSPALAATVFVCRPPLETPTGRFLGIVHFQRLLREPPHAAIGTMLDKDVEPLRPNAPLGQVTRMLATYNLVGVPVVDDEGRLVGRGHRRRRARPHPARRLARGTARGDPWPRATATAGRAWTSRARAAAAGSAARRTTRRPSAGASERFARFMGTASFLVCMTVFVAALDASGTSWPPADQRFDPYPFIFLTLMLSLQASYAAPLILLAQNRQADRDRVPLEQDRAATSATSPTPSTSPARSPRCASRCATSPPATSSAPSCATCSRSWRSAGWTSTARGPRARPEARRPAPAPRAAADPRAPARRPRHGAMPQRQPQDALPPRSRRSSTPRSASPSPSSAWSSRVTVAADGRAAVTILLDRRPAARSRRPSPSDTTAALADRRRASPRST